MLSKTQKIWIAPLLLLFASSIMIGHARAEFIAEKSNQSKAKIEAIYVTNPDGQKHPYYKIADFAQYLPIQISYDQARNRGIIYIQHKISSKKLYFIIGHNQFKFQDRLLRAPWPVLNRNSFVFFPKDILYPLCNYYYHNSLQWHKDTVFIKAIASREQSFTIANIDKLIGNKNSKTSKDNKYKLDLGLDKAIIEKKIENKKEDLNQSDQKKNPYSKLSQDRKPKNQPLPQKRIQPRFENDSQYGQWSNKPMQNIIIDAGHGGRDPGAIFGKGKKQIQEKNITLAVAKLLAKELKKRYPNKKIIMTRNKDHYVSLEKRTEIANSIYRQKGGAMFISIHVNSSLSNRTKGLEIYYLAPNSNNEANRTSYILENNFIHNVKSLKEDTQPIESYLLNHQIQQESKKLAKMMIGQFKSDLTSQIKIRGSRQADFVVLRGSIMPAVLVEMGYLSHKSDRQHLISSKYQKTIANSMAHSIGNFIQYYDNQLYRM